MTYSKIKSAYSVAAGEKLCIVIALGYGETQGVPHKIKAPVDVSETDGAAPDWFERGVREALLCVLSYRKCFIRFYIKLGRVFNKTVIFCRFSHRFSVAA